MCDLLFDLSHNIWFSDDICDSDCETCVYEPVVDHELDVGEDICAGLWTEILPNDMNEAASCSSNDSLRDNARDNFTFLNYHSLILLVDEIFSLLQVDCVGDDQTENLLASPERLGLQNGWLGEALF